MSLIFSILQSKKLTAEIRKMARTNSVDGQNQLILASDTNQSEPSDGSNEYQDNLAADELYQKKVTAESETSSDRAENGNN